MALEVVHSQVHSLMAMLELECGQISKGGEWLGKQLCQTDLGSYEEYQGHNLCGVRFICSGPRETIV
ncbi:hypothetical protein PAXRUDRAFT_821049 [Paxillus rubicundulus Ve08.2h10]|uniref:Uncharacterized protein n=1 Tax=Paxillus rubicundulus Ve08.2h10 TaxID=930991 RepID=A0A0D0EB87_9AGAM|nr:hypothetical protein PAXRUDRAFT_821049 [Paxillus rubicundulus Ve08.2h10]